MSNKQINEHPLQAMVRRNKAGGRAGMFSVCTANKYVLYAAVLYAKKHNCTIIIEATSNQVNQDGGYTGMVPDQFAQMVRQIIDEVGVNPEQIILGGDHLGPLTWCKESECSAMEKAAQLVRLYTLAGFSKIHIDTSMRLGDDDFSSPLETELSARRGAQLAAVVRDAFTQLQFQQPDARPPVLVIGSEVPVPGGSKQHEDIVAPTEPDQFREQVASFREKFALQGLDFSDVVAFVVQPGVEFGDDFVFQYDRDAARSLTDALKDYDDFVFEGHSTDYQTTDSLTRMVEDGVGILKVGPALTFALREALMALEQIEKELVQEKNKRSNFRCVLNACMDSDDKYWKAYYSGTPEEIEYKKLFSYSDRCRYYLPRAEVEEAVERLLKNLDMPIAPALISQHFPHLFEPYQRGQIGACARDLIAAHIGATLDRYAAACCML